MNENLTYEEWKTEIELWSTITEVPKSKQGGSLFFTLKGDARDTIRSKLKMTEISAEDGLQTIIKTLDDLYLKDSNQRSFTAYEDFINFRRQPETNIKDFIVQFNIRYNRIKNFKMELPDGVLAYNLLVSANLSKDQDQLCRATAASMTYEGMKTAIEKVAVSHIDKEEKVQTFLTSNDYDYNFESQNRNRCDTQDEYPSENLQETMYTTHNRNSHRGSYKSRAAPKSRIQQAIPNRNDEFGKPTTCSFCHSIYHWVQDCPHAAHEDRNKHGRGRYRGSFRGARGGGYRGKSL